MRVWNWTSEYWKGLKQLPEMMEKLYKRLVPTRVFTKKDYWKKWYDNASIKNYNASGLYLICSVYVISKTVVWIPRFIEFDL